MTKAPSRLSTAERLAKLESQMKEAEARLKEEHRARLYSLGVVVNALLADDSALRAVLVPKLRDAVRGSRRRADLAEWLAQLDPSVADAPAPAKPALLQLPEPQPPPLAVAAE